MIVELRNHELELLPERAVWWQQQGTLVVTDTHFGKGESFRHGGLPIPTGTLAADLARLSDLLQRHQPRRLLHLGDFFHARQGVTPRVANELLAWRQQHADLEIILVAGNHDRHAGRPAPELGITTVAEPYELATITAYHKPPARAFGDSLALAGHLHPGVVVKDRLDRLRLPCFHYQNGTLVLPAFSTFTGLAEMPTAPDCRQWLIADTVRELRNTSVDPGRRTGFHPRQA